MPKETKKTGIRTGTGAIGVPNTPKSKSETGTITSSTQHNTAKAPSMQSDAILSTAFAWDSRGRAWMPPVSELAPVPNRLHKDDDRNARFLLRAAK